jgi:hypothetical protein
VSQVEPPKGGELKANKIRKAYFITEKNTLEFVEGNTKRRKVSVGSTK